MNITYNNVSGLLTSYTQEDLYQIPSIYLGPQFVIILRHFDEGVLGMVFYRWYGLVEIHTTAVANFKNLHREFRLVGSIGNWCTPPFRGSEGRRGSFLLRGA